MFLQMTLFHSLLWLSGIPLFIRTTSYFSIRLLLDTENGIPSWFLSIVLLWTMGCLCLYELVFIFSRSMPRSGIAGLYDNFIFSFLRNQDTVLHRGFPSFHSRQLWRRVPFSPHAALMLLIAFPFITLWINPKILNTTHKILNVLALPFSPAWSEQFSFIHCALVTLTFQFLKLICFFLPQDLCRCHEAQYLMLFALCVHFQLLINPTVFQIWKIWDLSGWRSSFTFSEKPFLISSTSVQFSHSVMSYSLRPHGLQHARLPCPSPTARASSNSWPLSGWYQPPISPSVIPFFSCLQSFPASDSFPMSQLLTSGGQSIGASASTSVLPMNI